MAAQSHPSRTLHIAFALFGVGLLAVVAIFVLAAMGHTAPWLWAVSMAFPVGLALAVVHVVRRR
ncbi:hypothetical protein [Actinokineospora globicatena]|uniref:Uncharacterized protein n=1 Tax=Actinokineospora globicatena TaxID=103729 RepID=A0A9W6QMX8_9PSEU|nr:hypothetical protein [Actinokineospora globicatena]MCP2300776.1 hypothetical protein [Actinokineospora globicatena]GLW77599.1 hypothetical protein Aglo01_20810 [Actinokineospora globicatena]GLW84433.1 hypothetical protein Aglo02_20730 [Actinokineospora globicatena]GLW92981.1 hypothetical protein Aglo03_37970 [Actinokineospora globicatena]